MTMKNKLIDWNEYQFRCSGIGDLMTGANLGLTYRQESMLADYQERHQGKGKPLTERQLAVMGDLLKRKHEKPALPVSVKSVLNKLWAEETFQKRREVETKYMDKGIIVEEMSISLYSRVIGKPFFKNKERKKNDLISGEPDNTYDSVIRDIKSSWDLTTFPFNETEIPNKNYYWQLMGYMDLWEFQRAELIYCLVDTPEELINDEKFRVARKTGYLDLPDFLENEVINRMTFSDIPEPMRVNVFDLKYDFEAVKAMYKRLYQCREYLFELNEKYGNKMINFFTEKLQEA